MGSREVPSAAAGCAGRADIPANWSGEARHQLLCGTLTCRASGGEEGPVVRGCTRTLGGRLDARVVLREELQRPECGC
ncbi:hypothetical protein NDU88_004734 [Pleurodeles waltl]|uniref:Uncharacterized protein n=1 Tax=Pleurodeles waltl TaxID=8319 RepID=A0AAV7NPB9_PLEWA|nr:hypothetical protein NDU88_004734 [Pleurodeles waltl]